MGWVGLPTRPCHLNPRTLPKLSERNATLPKLRRPDPVGVEGGGVGESFLHVGDHTRVSARQVERQVEGRQIGVERGGAFECARHAGALAHVSLEYALSFSLGQIKSNI